MINLQTISLMLFTSLAANASNDLSTFYCKQRKNPALDSAVRYDLRIIETKELPRGTDDYRKAVTIQRLRVVGARTSVVKSFTSVASYNDVLLEIKAPENDFLFSLYLDENDPAVVISHDSSGSQVKEKFDCELE